MQSSITLTVIVFIGILCIKYDRGIASSIVRKRDYSVKLSNASRLGPETHHSTTNDCASDSECTQHGTCKEGKCACDKGWLTWRDSPRCSYEQRSKTTALIVSILLGGLGVDWFYLARKNWLYVLVGVIKLLVSTGCCFGVPLRKVNEKCAAACSTGGGIAATIWWIVDWARIIANHFPDGNGAPLMSW